MKIVLVVVNDFAEFKRGHEIEDPSVVAEILASSNAANVVARPAADLPDDQPA